MKILVFLLSGLLIMAGTAGAATSRYPVPSNDNESLQTYKSAIFESTDKVQNELSGRVRIINMFPAPLAKFYASIFLENKGKKPIDINTLHYYAVKNDGKEMELGFMGIEGPHKSTLLLPGNSVLIKCTFSGDGQDTKSIYIKEGGNIIAQFNFAGMYKDEVAVLAGSKK